MTLRRAGGKFTQVGDFYRRASCDLVPSYKLTRPVFGGTRIARWGSPTASRSGRGERHGAARQQVVKRFAAAPGGEPDAGHAAGARAARATTRSG